jgi:hypothetical protein
MEHSPIPTTSTKREQKASHKCICCNIDNATGRNALVVSAETVAHGIIEHFSTAIPSFDILFTRIDDISIPDELCNGLNMLSILHRKSSFHQTTIDLFRNLEGYTDDDDYYVNEIELAKKKLASAATEFEQEEARFETAKSAFVEAFCNTHCNIDFRRCKKVTECSVSQSLLQIQNDTTNHHSKNC